jgi:activating signal cointegrator complex subunit 2
VGGFHSTLTISALCLLYLQTEFISPEYFGKLIYDNYVFTIPMILDICMLYGRENRAQVLQIIDTLFQVQPKYQEDLEKSVHFICKVRL